MAQAIRVAASSAAAVPGAAVDLDRRARELSADPDRAWAAPEVSPDARRRQPRAPSTDLGADCFADLTMLARRSARAESALADGVGELPTGPRRAHDEALARAERAGVMVSGPLGLCFLRPSSAWTSFPWSSASRRRPGSLWKTCAGRAKSPPAASNCNVRTPKGKTMSHTVNQSSPTTPTPSENRAARATGDWLNAQTLRLISDGG